MTAEVVSFAVASPSASYGRELAPAQAFVADAAHHLKDIAAALGASLAERRDAEATSGRLADDIALASGRLQRSAPGLLVVAYSGHGGRIPHRADEGHGSFDAAWALDDRPLSATALAHLLRAVDDDIHVVVISNCCHGGGMFDALDATTAKATDGATASPATLQGAGSNRVLVAACLKHQGTLLTSESRLTARLLEQLFPMREGARRPRAINYSQLSNELASIASTAQTPVVRASAPDLRRAAFAAQRRAP